MSMRFWKTITIAFMIFSRKIWGLCFVGFAILLVGCSAANQKIASRTGFNRAQHMQGFYKTESRAVGDVFSGKASYYGPGFHGKKTANGETYDQNDHTCAHKTLPFNTKLKVMLESTGKSTIVRVNDRGPYKDSRILDLSVQAAKDIGLVAEGVGTVEAEVVE